MWVSLMYQFASKNKASVRCNELKWAVTDILIMSNCYVNCQKFEHHVSTSFWYVACRRRHIFETFSGKPVVNMKEILFESIKSKTTYTETHLFFCTVLEVCTQKRLALMLDGTSFRGNVFQKQ